MLIVKKVPIVPPLLIYNQFVTDFQEEVTQAGFICSKLTIETLDQGVKICSKLTIKIPQRCQWRRSGVFLINFEHI